MDLFQVFKMWLLPAFSCCPGSWSQLWLLRSLVGLARKTRSMAVVTLSGEGSSNLHIWECLKDPVNTSHQVNSKQKASPIPWPGQERRSQHQITNYKQPFQNSRRSGQKDERSSYRPGWATSWSPTPRRNKGLAACSTLALYTKGTEVVCSNQDPFFFWGGSGIVISNGLQTGF